MAQLGPESARQYTLRTGGTVCSGGLPPALVLNAGTVPAVVA